MDHADHRLAHALALGIARRDLELVDRIVEEPHLAVGETEIVVGGAVGLRDLGAHAGLELGEHLFDVDLLGRLAEAPPALALGRPVERIEGVERRGDVESAIGPAVCFGLVERALARAAGARSSG